MKQERWIESILQSMEGSQKAKPSKALYNQILDQIKQQKARQRFFKYSLIAAFVLFVFNILILLRSDVTQAPNNIDIEQVPNELALISDYNLYE